LGACQDSRQIRPASAADSADFAALIDQAYAKYVERIGGKPAPMTADYAALIEAGDVWILDIGGRLAGGMILRDGSDHLLVSNVVVSPKCQGQGLGAYLLAFADAEARRRRLPELRLYTNEKMHENLVIYERLGWVRYAEREEDGFRRIFMKKQVSG